MSAACETVIIFLVMTVYICFYKIARALLEREVGEKGGREEAEAVSVSFPLPLSLASISIAFCLAALLLVPLFALSISIPLSFSLSIFSFSLSIYLLLSLLHLRLFSSLFVSRSLRRCPSLSLSIRPCLPTPPDTPASPIALRPHGTSCHTRLTWRRIKTGKDRRRQKVTRE